MAPSQSTSRPESVDVGSSSRRVRGLRRIALAISIFCLTARSNPPTSSSSAISDMSSAAKCSPTSSRARRRRIVPNGRRDQFEQNAHYHNLTNHLAPVARSITRLCRSSSIKRRWIREFELQREAVREKIAMIQQRSLGTKNRAKIALTVEQGLMHLEKIGGMDLFHDESLDELRASIVVLRAQLAKAMKDAVENGSPLGRLSPQKRAMYEHLFALIYECSANRTAAKSLVDRILMKLA